jgi:anti-sigma factor ChrR (cupin superfamily)
LSRWEDDLVDRFIAEIPDDGGLDLVANALAAKAEVPRPGVRDAILAKARSTGRYDRFAKTVAEMIDVDEASASSLLDGIDRKESWVKGPVPGVLLYHLSGGPKVDNCVVGFIRMEQGTVFPEHEHLGEERVLCLQGSYRDNVSGEVYRSGDTIVNPAHMSHDFVVRPGPALVYLVVLEEGVRIGPHVIRARDPRL